MMRWHYVERKENDILISVKVNDDSHATVCTVYGSTSPMNDQYVGASRLTENVNLICAAHDLLKAAQAVCEAWGKFIDSFDYVPGIGDLAEDIEFQEMARLRRAIAKALA